MSDEYEFDDEGYGGEGSAEYTFDDDEGGMAWGRTDSVMVPSSVKKFDTLTPQEALAEIEAVQKEASGLLSWSPASATLLLRAFQWNLPMLQDRYFEDMDKTMSKARVTGSTPGVWKATTAPAECCVCWDDLEPGEAGHLECGHTACRGCWTGHLEFQLKNKGEDSLAARCPADKCQQICGRESYIAVFGKDSPQVGKFDEYLVRSFVQARPQVKACRSPHCASIVRWLLPAVPQDYAAVTCHTCNTPFCFCCTEDDHGPASCKMLKLWREKESSESETANWVVANTKTCPGKNCGRATEKNGGCNHMTCPQCRHEWCWVCEGPWSEHGTSWYNCNQFDKNKDKDKQRARDQARSDLERYIHYYTRFRNHEQSRKLDEKVLRRTRQRMRDELSRDTARSLADVEYLEKTAEVLLLCRHTLMYTYVYAFYIEDATKKRLFEYNQSQLEFATEQLSGFIETDKSERQTVVNHTSAAAGFLEKLKEGCVDVS